MTARRDLPHQRGIALGDPAENEERAPDAVPIETLQQAPGIADNAAVPLGP